jgi:hypothetical protein
MDLTFEVGDADHEKLVEVGAEDGQEFHACRLSLSPWRRRR